VAHPIAANDIALGRMSLIESARQLREFAALPPTDQSPSGRPQAGSADNPRRIGFLLLPKFSMMAFVSAVEPLRVANRFGGALYRWEVLSETGEPVTASNGMSLVADASLATTGRYSTVIVCAGFAPETHFSRRMGAWLRRLDHEGVTLGAMDTGSFLLARAGLLDGYRATTHWESLDSFRERFPRVEVEAGLFVFDRNRLTCAGGTAALDMMLHLIRLQHGHRLAVAVADQFVYTRIRDARDRQRMEPQSRLGVFRSELARVVSLMEEHLEDPLTIEQISEAAGVSLRQLERLFQRHFRCTPRRYYLDLRLQRARSLLQYTDMPVFEIALACGFGSSAHFSRSYREWAGKPPSAERHATESETVASPS
jgi:AraC family carnitine catabolism transcriptional activator